MKTHLSRYAGALQEIELDVWQKSEVLYIRVITRKWITSGPIGQGHWVAYQLVWCLSTLIG